MRRLVLFVLLLPLCMSGVVLEAAAQPSVLQITLLDTGNPRPNMERFGTAILVEGGGTDVLIDAGRGKAQRLFDLSGRAGLVNVDALFLT